MDPLNREWQPASGVVLHADQLATIYHPMNSVIDASAGSGKTEVLAHLVMHRFQTRAIPIPKRVLMLSYKRDAARNLRERVKQNVPDEAFRIQSLTLDALAKGFVDRFRPALPARWRLDPYKLDFNNLSKYGLEWFDENDNTTQQAWERVMRGPNAKASLPMLARLASIVLATNPQLLSKVRAAFGLVLVDEVQDTTDPQFQLLRTAFAGSQVQVVAVGDEKQRIMKWAGALPHALDSFQQAFAAQRFNLRINYRSKTRLVEMQARALRSLGFAQHIPQQAAPGRDGGSCEFAEFADERAEATWIGRTVRGWLDESRQPRDVAILIRNRYRVQPAAIVRALATQGVQARHDDELQDLNAEPLVVCILDALEIAAGGQSTREPWKRLMQIVQNMHGRRLGPDEVGPVAQLERLNTDLRALLAGVPLTGALAEQAAYLTAERLGWTRMGVIHAPYLDEEYLEVVCDWFGRAIAPMLTGKDLRSAVREFRGEHLVPILTVHKSKGLQFHSVIVAGVEDGHYRSREAGTVDEEERSNLFVAISRASDRLFLTRCARRQQGVQSWTELAPFYDAYRGPQPAAP